MNLRYAQEFEQIIFPNWYFKTLLHTTLKIHEHINVEYAIISSQI